MPCGNIIGSVCEKLFGTCSFSCNKTKKTTNTNNNVVIITDPSPENIDTIQKLFQNQRLPFRNGPIPSIHEESEPNESPSLEQMIKESRKLTYTYHPLPLTTVDVDEENPTAMRQVHEKARVTAFKVAKFAIQSFSPNQELSHEEGWSRYLLAVYLTEKAQRPRKFDLEERFKNNEQIYMNEFEIFNNNIELVRLFGAAAATLWRILKTYKVQDIHDLNRLRDAHLITSEQIQILEHALDDTDDLIGGPNFSDLSLPVQAIYLEAARKFNPAYLLHRNGSYIPWFHRDDDADLSQSNPVLRRTLSGHLGLRPLNVLSGDSTDFKLEDENREYSQLLDRLTVRDPSIDPDKEIQFAVLRAQILCYVLDISTDKVIEGTLSKEEIRSIDRYVDRLKELQGTMYHIFRSIKKTTRWQALQRQRQFTDAAIKIYLDENDIQKDFAVDLHNAPSVFSLKSKVYALAVLFKIANAFDEDIIDRLNKTHPISTWFITEHKDTPVDLTPSSFIGRRSLQMTPSTSPKIEILGLSGITPNGHEENERRRNSISQLRIDLTSSERWRQRTPSMEMPLLPPNAGGDLFIFPSPDATKEVHIQPVSRTSSGSKTRSSFSLAVPLPSSAVATPSPMLTLSAAQPDSSGILSPLPESTASSTSSSEPEPSPSLTIRSIQTPASEPSSAPIASLTSSEAAESNRLSNLNLPPLALRTLSSLSETPESTRPRTISSPPLAPRSLSSLSETPESMRPRTISSPPLAVSSDTSASAASSAEMLKPRRQIVSLQTIVIEQSPPLPNGPSNPTAALSPPSITRSIAPPWPPFGPIASTTPRALTSGATPPPSVLGSLASPTPAPMAAPISTPFNSDVTTEQVSLNP
ncbi:MAG: hypothetical protein JSS32_03970 [Verrucomicrobia bacterium]|nr:hypothetical protein [Verrucomicrobiota bacterium]